MSPSSTFLASSSRSISTKTSWDFRPLVEVYTVFVTGPLRWYFRFAARNKRDEPRPTSGPGEKHRRNMLFSVHHNILNLLNIFIILALLIFCCTFFQDIVTNFHSQSAGSLALFINAHTKNDGPRLLGFRYLIERHRKQGGDMDRKCLLSSLLLSWRPA